MQTPTASAVLQVATITLTQAQVLVLNDTPQTVVPAQGAGTVIFLTGAVVQVKGSATYLTDDDELLLVLNDGTILSFSAFGGSTGDDVYLLANFAVGQNGYQVNAALYENQPIVATTTDENPTGTGGDVTITAYYVVLTLP